MPARCTVLIAARELLEPLQRGLIADGEVLAFADGDMSRALELITERRPALVAVERLFASSPRGTALIKRIKSDKSLANTEVVILTHDKHASRTVHRFEPPAPKPPDQQQGTRRAPRITIRQGVEVLVDGNPASLIDLSLVGAQLLSSVRLKPNTRVRLTLIDEDVATRIGGAVVWARFEIPDGTGEPRYRAGIQFADPEPGVLERLFSRWKA